MAQGVSAREPLPGCTPSAPQILGPPSAILLTPSLLIKRQGPERHGGAEGRNGAKPAFPEQGQPAHDQWTDPSCKNQSPELTTGVRLSSRQSGEEKARSRGGCGGGAKRIRLTMPTFPSNRTGLVTVPVFPAVGCGLPSWPCCPAALLQGHVRHLATSPTLPGFMPLV